MRLVSRSPPSRGWKFVFIGAETYVLAVFLLVTVPDLLLGRPRSHITGPIILPAQVLYAVGVMFLLLASPFFIPSLRRLALAGWLIGFVVLLVGLMTPATGSR